MMVNVKLYAALQKYAPSGTDVGEAFSVELESGTILELIEELGIEEELASIVMVNGIQVIDMNHALQVDDLVVIFPPIGGG
ncbi:MAG: MoaD/ThiS family protein [Candidatus Thorarchaeota archaeon]